MESLSSSTFKHPDTGETGKNVIIFGADITDSKHENNQKQSILVLGYGSITRINDTEIYAEKSYTPDFTSDNKVTCLSLHYNSSNSFLYVNGKQVTQFKAKNTEINKEPIAIGNISNKDYLSDADIESSKFHGNIYDFSVDYERISNENI